MTRTRMTRRTSEAISRVGRAWGRGEIRYACTCMCLDTLDTLGTTLLEMGCSGSVKSL